MNLPRILLLGGTAEGRALAADLVRRSIPVTSSLAGRVANPRLPAGETRIGGFGGSAGLRDWLRANDIDIVVDATHPFAATITDHAVTAAADVGVPVLRLRRTPWLPEADDHWITVPSMETAADTVRALGGRVLLTTGRRDVGVFADIDSAWFAIRVVDPPAPPLPPHRLVIRSRGPYDLAGELDLMRTHRITALVTKNSGGALTHPKLVAARDLGVRVVMIDRPTEPAAAAVVDDVAAALDWLTGRF